MPTGTQDAGLVVEEKELTSADDDEMR